MSDTFRANYRELTGEDKVAIQNIKHRANELLKAIDSAEALLCLGNRGREFSLARTRLEESVMWATKAIA